MTVSADPCSYRRAPGSTPAAHAADMRGSVSRHLRLEMHLMTAAPRPLRVLLLAGTFAAACSWLRPATHADWHQLTTVVRWPSSRASFKVYVKLYVKQALQIGENLRSSQSFLRQTQA